MLFRSTVQHGLALAERELLQGLGRQGPGGAGPGAGPAVIADGLLGQGRVRVQFEIGGYEREKLPGTELGRQEQSATPKMTEARRMGGELHVQHHVGGRAHVLAYKTGPLRHIGAGIGGRGVVGRR